MPFTVGGAVAASAAADAFGRWTVDRFDASPWPPVRLHTAIEAACVTLGILVAGVLLILRRSGRGSGLCVPLACGLLATAALDASHALLLSGERLVAMHAVAALATGVLFALVLLPERLTHWAAWTAVALTAALCVGLIVIASMPEVLVAAFLARGLPLLVSTANTVGGGLMIAAAFGLVSDKREAPAPNVRGFGLVCGVIGAAALIHAWSPIPGSSWSWLVLRIVAYGIAVWLAGTCVVRMQRAVVKQRLELEAAHDEALRVADDRAGELVALRAAMDNHTLFSIADARGRIVEVNEGFCRISGYSREELLGQDHRLLNSGYHGKLFWVDMWKTIASGSSWRGEVCNRTKDGALYWVDSTNIPQFGPDGRVVRYISLRFDITAQRRALAELREFRSILDSCNDCIFMFDADTLRFVYANLGATEQIGHAFADLEHMSPVDLAPEYDEAQFLEELRPLFEEPGTSRVLRTMLRHRDGADIPVEMSLQLISDVSDHDRFFAVVRDIGEQIETEQRMLEAKDHAEQASKAKSEFLANMSHEIRTPMTAILGYVDLLAESDSGDDTCREHIETIRRNGEYLLAVINDVLDVSKIEAGQLHVERLPTNAALLVEEVAALSLPRAQIKGIDLRVSFTTPIPTTIECDPTRLRQILLNLVGNAIKFTDTGSVTVRVSCDPAACSITFDVLDTGIGMSEKQRSLIATFQPFSQADASTTRLYGGTGLGLRITNALATKLGGSIRVESTLGSGSTFTVTLPTGSLRGVPMATPGLATTSPRQGGTREQRQLRTPSRHPRSARRGRSRQPETYRVSSPARGRIRRGVRQRARRGRDHRTSRDGRPAAHCAHGHPNAGTRRLLHDAAAPQRWVPSPGHRGHCSCNGRRPKQVYRRGMRRIPHEADRCPTDDRHLCSPCPHGEAGCTVATKTTLRVTRTAASACAPRGSRDAAAPAVGLTCAIASEAGVR
ncbi:MAG: PAS domain S-box protein [Planctomycetota bacterium]